MNGFTLLELTLALGIGAVMLAGMVMLAEAFTRSLRQQAALSGLQERLGFAVGELRRGAESAGFSPRPWETGSEPSAVSGSVAMATPGGDRLTVRRWSRRNCLGNHNPTVDPDGQPAFGLLVSTYEVREDRGLVRTCHFGPGPGPGVRQLNAASLVEGIEALVLRFGEDRDGDGLVDRWVSPGAWADEARVIGVRIGLLAAGPGDPGLASGEPTPPFRVLGRSLHPARDGRPRRAVTVTVPLRSRL
jgi:hypothetical protein